MSALQTEQEQREVEELVRQLEGLSEDEIEQELARRQGAASPEA